MDENCFFGGFRLHWGVGRLRAALKEMGGMVAGWLVHPGGERGIRVKANQSYEFFLMTGILFAQERWMDT